MKFVADAMLGRLAKRLRLHGLDVLYDPAADDNAVLRRALEEGRTILTRDTGLASRPLARNCLLIASDRVDEQEEQVLAATPREALRAPLTRCSLCNGLLEPVDRDSVQNLVPDHVFRNTKTFVRCSACGRVYWQGSHAARMHIRDGQ